jgi:hypothetical protein
MSTWRRRATAIGILTSEVMDMNLGGDHGGTESP